jgi:hypothetical protein
MILVEKIDPEKLRKLFMSVSRRAKNGGNLRHYKGYMLIDISSNPIGCVFRVPISRDVHKLILF